MPLGGKWPPVSSVRMGFHRAGKSAISKNAQNHATKNITSEAMNRIMPVAQVQRHHLGVIARAAFLHHVAPPAVHGVEHHGQADEEQPRLRQSRPNIKSGSPLLYLNRPSAPSAMTKAPMEPTNGHGLGSTR